MRNKCVLACLATAILLAAMPVSYSEATPSKQALVYGSGIAADDIGNIEISNENYASRGHSPISYRFRAEHSGTVDKIVFWLKFTRDPVRERTYSLGNGGKVLVQLRTDDGTEQHNPSGTVLGSKLINYPMGPTPDYEGDFDPAVCSFPIIALDPAPGKDLQLAEGNLYHIVFSNPVEDPIGNWVSLNNLVNAEGGKDMQPRYSDDDLAVLQYQNTQWGIDYYYIPIYALYFTNGNSQGQGYIDVWSNYAPFNISNGNIVKEIFTVSGGNKTVTAVSVRLEKSAAYPNPGNLTFKLKTADGALIEEGNVPASAIPYGRTWVTYKFSSPHTLETGETYNLVLSAPEGDPYIIYPLYAGYQYNLNVGLVFKDGWAVYSNNSGLNWSGFGNWGDHSSNPLDFQFYFSVEFCGDTKCNSEIGENCSNCPTDCGACCGNGTCDAGETFATCPRDCPPECVDTLTLMNQYIPQWKKGEITMLALMQKMRQWSAGTGCQSA